MCRGRVGHPVRTQIFRDLQNRIYILSFNIRLGCVIHTISTANQPFSLQIEPSTVHVFPVTASPTRPFRSSPATIGPDVRLVFQALDFLERFNTNKLSEEDCNMIVGVGEKNKWKRTAEISLGKMKKIVKMVDAKVIPVAFGKGSPCNAVNCPYWLVEFHDTHM